MSVYGYITPQIMHQSPTTQSPPDNATNILLNYPGREGQKKGRGGGEEAERKGGGKGTDRERQ